MAHNSGVLFSVERNVARIILARPERCNALDTMAWSALAKVCSDIRARSDIRAVVITGSGEHFSAGADVRELAEHIHDAAWMRNNQAEVGAALDVFAALPQPTIAVVHGCCFGGGIALAVASDFRICTDDARFAITPARLGLSYRLVDCLRVVDVFGSARARELLLRAREVDGAMMLAWGAVNDCVAAAAMDACVNDWLNDLCALSGVSQRAIKASLLKIRHGAGADDAESLSAFSDAFSQPDFHEGARAFVEKRRPVF